MTSHDPQRTPITDPKRISHSDPTYLRTYERTEKAKTWVDPYLAERARMYGIRSHLTVPGLASSPAIRKPTNGAPMPADFRKGEQQ